MRDWLLILFGVFALLMAGVCQSQHWRIVDLNARLAAIEELVLPDIPPEYK